MITTTAKTTQWFTELDGKTLFHKAIATVEKSSTPPFAGHLEPYQKVHRCNCVHDAGNPPLPGGFTGAFAFEDKIMRHWSFPKEKDKHFSYRQIDQELIRQKIVNQFGQTMLVWQIMLDGYVSEDGQFYYFRLSHAGGNFAGCEVDYYVDFNPDTQILTLHVREKLYREKYKRYQFDFELQNAKTPRTSYSQPHGASETQSVFVPVPAK